MEEDSMTNKEYDEISNLKKEIKKLRKLLRHFFRMGDGIPYAQWSKEQHAAHDILKKGIK